MKKPPAEPPRLRRPEDGRCETGPIEALLEDDSDDILFSDTVERLRNRERYGNGHGPGPAHRHYSIEPAPMPAWLAKIGKKNAG